MNFPITSSLIKCCKESHKRYKVYLAEQTKLEKAESEKVKQTELLAKSLQQQKTGLELIEADIRYIVYDCFNKISIFSLFYCLNFVIE